MKPLIFLFVILSLKSFSQEYKLSENSNGMSIHLMNVIDNDSLLLPNYFFEKTSDNYLKFQIVLGNNEPIIVDIDKKKIDFKLEFYENFRGIDIYNVLIPLQEIINNSTINILYSTEKDLSMSMSIESNLFPFVINKKYLNNLLVGNNLISKNRVKFQAEDWFEREKKYFKVKTNEDRIYKINTEKLSNAIGNINISNIGVKLYGEDYPFFYVKSSDNILDGNDEFYLLGKVQRGDTTYFEHYNSNVSFYIYESKLPISSLNKKETNNNEKVDFVNRSLHFERDTIFSYGYDFRIVDAADNLYEGWYYKIIDASELSKNDFSLNVKIYPKNIDSISLRYVTQTEGKTGFFDIYNMTFYLNNFLTDSTLFSKFKKVDYSFPTDNLILGTNSLKLKSNSFTNNIGNKEVGRVGIDFANISGLFYTIADNNNFNFITNSNENSFIEVLNYNYPEVISIDKTNKTIEFANSKNQSFFNGGISKDKKFASISINDVNVYGEGNYQLIYLKNNNLQSLSSDKVQDILQVINDNPTIFLLLVKSEFDNVLKTKLSNLGFTTYDNSSYYFMNDKSKNSLQINSNEQFHQEFIAENLNSFSAKVNLNSGNNEYIVTSLDNKKLDGEVIQFSNLKDVSNQADVLYVTSKSLSSSVQKYLEYRKSVYMELTFKVAYIEDIYNEFSYGIEGPHSLKDFLKYVYNNWQSPKISYVYLIGETSWDSDYRATAAFVKSLVPTYGLPVTDIWYADLDETNKSREEVFVGRVTPNNDSELLNYLEKLKKFEEVKFAPWFKKALLLVGGKENEKDMFIDYSDKAFDVIYNSELKVDTSYISGIPKDGFEISKGPEIRNAINNGVLWTNFIGHGATTVFDMDGWAENQLNNFSRTGILSTLSCNTNAFGESVAPQSRNEAYIMYPKTGFIFTYGGTTLGMPGIQRLFIEEIMKALSDKNIKVRNVLELKRIGTKPLEFGYDIHYQSFNTLGDPLINIPFSINTDFYFQENDIFVDNNNNIISVDDTTVTIKTKIYNNGYCNDSNVVVKIESIYGNDTISYYDTLNIICNSLEYSFNINVYQLAGVHKVKILIDSENYYNEDYENNNETEIVFNVYNRSLIPIDPKDNWNISNINPQFRFYDAKYLNERKYKFSLFDNDKIITSKDNEITVKDGNYITWSPIIELNLNEIVKLEYEIVDNDPKNIGKQVLNLNTKKFELNDNKYNIPLNLFNSDSLNYSDLKKSFGFNEKYIKIEARTEYRKFTDNTLEHIFISIDGKEIINNVRGAAGTYLVSINRTNLNLNDAKFFNTSWDKDVATNYINYIKDTLNMNDLIIIITTVDGFGSFLGHCKPNSNCYIDSLKAVFREKFNSKLIDSVRELNDRMRYILIYSKTTEGNLLNEVVQKEKDSEKELVLIDSLIKPVYNADFEFTLPNDINILKDLTIEGKNNNAIISISAFDKNNNLFNTYSLNDLENNNNVELSDSIYKVKVNLSRDSLKYKPEINNITINYKPFPELGVINITEKFDSLMRGEDFELNYRVSNYSLRSLLDSSKLNLSINSQQVDNFNIVDLVHNSDTIFNTNIITDNLISKNNITARLNQLNSIKEVINSDNFNNYLLNIFEDREAPILKAFANSSEIFDQSFVSETSTFTINLYDNSKLPINDKSKFTRVRLNGWVDDGDITFSNTFMDNEDPTLKASIQFTSDRLELGEYNTNLLEVTAQDATGNKTEIVYYLNITRRNALDSLKNYPNPFENEFDVAFNYIGSIEPNIAKMVLYDLNGKIIFTKILNNVKIGKNEIKVRLSEDTKAFINGNYIIMIQLSNSSENVNAIIQKMK